MSSPPAIPSSRLAIIQDAKGKPELAEIPIPALTPWTILVKAAAVALDPSDYKMGATFPIPSTIITVASGTDMDLMLGDTVAGGSHSSNPGNSENRAFVTYIRAPAPLTMRLTPTAKLTLEQAATLATALATALATCTLALWSADALALLPLTPEQPGEKPLSILVYSSSSATGTIPIQLLRLSGLDPITMCSPHNFALVCSCGTAAVFDYTDPDTLAAIKKHTGDQLKHVLDCILNTQSMEACFGAMAQVDEWYASLELVPDEMLTKRHTVHARLVMVFEILGEEIRLPGGYRKLMDPVKRELDM